MVLHLHYSETFGFGVAVSPSSRKQSPIMLDDVSEAFDDLISLADEDRPKTPQRRRMADAASGPMFDEISISSSIDPMEFTYVRSVSSSCGIGGKLLLPKLETYCLVGILVTELIL